MYYDLGAVPVGTVSRVLSDGTPVQLVPPAGPTSPHPSLYFPTRTLAQVTSIQRAEGLNMLRELYPGLQNWTNRYSDTAPPDWLEPAAVPVVAVAPAPVTLAPIVSTVAPPVTVATVTPAAPVVDAGGEEPAAAVASLGGGASKLVQLAVIGAVGFALLRRR